MLLTGQTHQEDAFVGLGHRTASETGLARTRRVSYEGTYTRFGVFVLLAPLFFVLPYGCMTNASWTGGPVTQMSPLLYPRLKWISCATVAEY